MRGGELGGGHRLALALLVLGAVWFVKPAPAQELPAPCSGLLRGRHSLARSDLLAPEGLVDGDDLLARVNRSPAGALPADYAPSDLVDIATMRPARAEACVPPRKQCLRAEAAEAYRSLARAMRDAGLEPRVVSAFRSYRVQCATFSRWAQRDGFCRAATSSALPGHSQHQLGTTIDVFTRDWLAGGARFREGFGCSPGGRFLAAHAHEHGFVLPYPLHPDYRREGSDCRGREEGDEARIDPRTGYRYEPWHLRYIGRENAMRFHRGWLASGPGTPGELTLEAWLAREKGDSAPIAAPVCDGCNCDRCATFAGENERRPCERPPLRLDARGRPIAATSAPSLLSVELSREGERLLLHARISVPENTLTQPPIVTPASSAFFARGKREAQLVDREPRAFADLEGTHRLAIGFGEREDDWPWRAGLVAPRRDGTENGHNARIPAPPGELSLTIPMEGVLPGTVVRVGLASGDEVREVRRLRAPPEPGR